MNQIEKAESQSLAKPNRATAAAQDVPAATNTVARFLGILLRYKWSILSVAVGGSALGYVATSRLAPLYTAEAMVWIESSVRAQAGMGPIQSRELLSSQSWIQLLKSFEVLDHTVRTTRLYLWWLPSDSAAFADFDINETVTPGSYRLLVDRQGRTYTLTTSNGAVIERRVVGDSVGVALGFRWKPGPEHLRRGRELVFSVELPRDVARGLAERLGAGMDRAESFLTVRLTDTSPTRAASVVNAAIDRFVEVAAQLKREKLDVLTGILSEQLAIADNNLRQAEIRLEGFRVSTITLPSERATPVTPGLESTRDPVFSNFFRMKTDIEEMRRDRDAIERALRAGAEGRIAIESLEMVPSVRSSSELQAAMRDIVEKRAELRSLQARYTTDFPPVRDAAAALEELETRVIPRLARQLVQELSTREASLVGLVASASTELEQIPPRMIEESRLRREVEIATNLHTQIQQQYENARLAAVSSVPDVSVLDRARTPERPSQDRRARLLFMATLGSLGLAIGLAVLRDRLDRRIRLPEHVTHELGLPILGVVPHIRRGRNGSLASDDAQQLIESFRTIQLNLSHAHGTGPIIITVTSAGIGDGKSFLTSNLGLVFAEMGKATLIIDGDVRRGILHHLVQRSRKPGLLDVLAGEAPLEFSVQETSHPKLRFIGSGTRRGDGPELLASAKMVSLVASLRQEYDVILIDSPPLGAATDPLILGTITGNLVLVLRDGATDRQFAEAKLAGVDRLPIRILGAVLNDVRLSGEYKYYSYLPGYGVTEERQSRLQSIIGKAGNGSAGGA